jgi:Flp pilus assembly protein TadG
MAVVDSNRVTASLHHSFLARLCATEAAQIVEFAVTLPLLMVFLIGIIDFGGAFTLKQKLNGAVREGARLGANQPTSDLYSALPSNQAPPTVNFIRDLVGEYLQWAKVDNCNITTPASTKKTGPLKWTYTASTGCAGVLTLVVDRGFPVANGANNWVITTHVTISYPRKWQFNRVIAVLIPGTNYAGSSPISSDAVVPNLD